MRISRVQITNFRNFAAVDIPLGEHAVILGENKTGKTNFVFALRLVLDPSLPDSARHLRQEDFWDGLERPLGPKARITISVDLTDFEHDPDLLSVLAEYPVSTDPMISRLTFAWQPLPDLVTGPTTDSDYEFILYGGDDIANRLNYQVRRRLPMEVIPALRDAEADLARWTRSPLRPLLDAAAAQMPRNRLEDVATGIDKATAQLASVSEVKAIAKAIRSKLLDMVGPSQALDTNLRFSPTDADKLIRALRVFIDGGRRSISEASLGSANMLFFALKALEHDLLAEAGDRDHTFLVIEEPEAHLHPSVQRLVFRHYLQGSPTDGDAMPSSTVLLTTHSPHIASVAPLSHIVLLRTSEAERATRATSAATAALSSREQRDLQRYIDVTRAELFFARGVILVEGDAERFMMPAIASAAGYDLDELGIVTCAIGGTHFTPFVKLLHRDALDIPFIVFTDYDPRRDRPDGTARKPLGPDRVVNQIMMHLMPRKEWDKASFAEVLALAPRHGVFLGEHTFEVDLFKAGLAKCFATAMRSVGTTASTAERMKEWAENPETCDEAAFLRDIEAVGKGRFAQRLASIVVRRKANAFPAYIGKGLAYLAQHVTPA